MFETFCRSTQCLSTISCATLRVRRLGVTRSATGRLASTPVADEVRRATLRSWRTFQACLPSGWETFSETWSRLGLTKSKPVGQHPEVPGAAHQTLEGSEPTEFPRRASMM